MAKLTEAQKEQIRIEYAAGASTRELAKKFSVSQTAIAKLLKIQKSVHDKEKCSDNEPDSKKTSNRDHAKNIIQKAYTALSTKDYDKIHPDTLLKIIERMTAIYGAEALEDSDTEAVTELIIEIEDASKDETED